MKQIYISNAIINAKTLDDVVELVSVGTCEGMEGFEFTSEQMAGQFAYICAKESGKEIDAVLIEDYLDTLADSGAAFNVLEAVSHGIAIYQLANDQ